MLICAVCKRPVDRVERDYDILRRETIFTVRCHGAVQVVRLQDCEVRDATRIAIGMAFADKPTEWLTARPAQLGEHDATEPE